MKIWVSAGILGWSGCICELQESSEVAEFSVNKSDFSRIISEMFKIKIADSYYMENCMSLGCKSQSNILHCDLFYTANT